MKYFTKKQLTFTIIIFIFIFSANIFNKVNVKASAGDSVVPTIENTEPTTTIIEETTTAIKETTAIIEETTKTDKITANNKKLKKSKLSPLKSKVIVIDPGHCNKHPGAHHNGLKEEKVVLDISKACQNKLNQYGDITVYMTRKSSKCCKSLHLGDCLTARNNYAKKLNADFLISMHINADDSPKKNGALILAAYNSGYNKTINKKTTELGKIVLSNLNSIGIKNNGFWMRRLSSSRYKNGALMDYYSIVRNGVLDKIPALIIEHGYVTNKSDCQKYFSTKSQRYLLGEKDADSIITYYNLNKKVINGKFIKKDKKTYYVTNNMQKVTGWVKHNGKWYYFNKKTGAMKKGFLKLGKNKFYLKPSTGEMAVGWFKVKGAKYLAKGNGALVKNTKYSDGLKTYKFDSLGRKK